MANPNKTVARARRAMGGFPKREPTEARKAEQADVPAPPDEALLARVMLKLFADRQLKVPEGVIPYLVVRMERSFSAAERLVAAIDGLALQQKRNISVEIAAEALASLGSQEP